ncbi:tubulin binding cofactor C-domain-containing protein [Collybia nuda]|uniref:Tubulin binding cofactor C-domain-containing protein n=1 Tax=Collybia nuda TaxID=64659 RepID=A0A9P5YEG2_9AGAR|nr:tubulin binding cofactor C-domain-containing protein [Collybia nuda]
MSTWTFAQEFGNQFKVSCSDIESRINFLKSASPVDQELFGEVNVELAKLTKSLADATGSLPSYDQRQYEQQLKALQNTLLEFQAATKPRSKFTFKRKPPATTTSTSRLPEVENTLTSLPTSHIPTTNLTLSSRSYEYVTFDTFPSSPLQHDLTISDLDHCIVNLVPYPFEPGVQDETIRPQLDISALHVNNITNTILLLPTIDGSVLLHKLSNCTLVVGCRQFRMHTSHNVDVYLSIPSTPIIEHCLDLRFAAYPKFLSQSQELEVREPFKHLSVQDFSHIRSTPSPHWSVLDNSRKTKDSWPLSPISTREELQSALAQNLPQ